MRTEKPLTAHVSTARRTTSSVPAAADSQPRTSLASQRPAVRQDQRDDAPFEPLVEPLGRATSPAGPPARATADVDETTSLLVNCPPMKAVVTLNAFCCPGGGVNTRCAYASVALPPRRVARRAPAR